MSTHPRQPCQNVSQTSLEAQHWCFYLPKRVHKRLAIGIRSSPVGASSLSVSVCYFPDLGGGYCVVCNSNVPSFANISAWGDGWLIALFHGFGGRAYIWLELVQACIYIIFLSPFLFHFLCVLSETASMSSVSQFLVNIPFTYPGFILWCSYLLLEI